MKANATDLPQPAPVTAPAPAEAVTALYRAHALGLIRLAVVMLGDRPAAEDAVQEAFCGLYRRWHSLADPGQGAELRAVQRDQRLPNALSPDGQRLALAVQPRKGPARTDLEVVTLSTGSTRVWAANGIFRSGGTDSRGLSWTADGRELAFEWQANNVGEFPGVEARLLSLTSAGGDLLAASRRVIATTRQFKPSGSTFQVTDTENEPVVTPDGSAIVTNSVYFQVKIEILGRGLERPVRLRRVLHQDREAHPDPRVLEDQARGVLFHAGAVVQPVGARAHRGHPRRPDRE